MRTVDYGIDVEVRLRGCAEDDEDGAETSGCVGVSSEQRSRCYLSDCWTVGQMKGGIESVMESWTVENLRESGIHLITINRPDR